MTEVDDLEILRDAWEHPDPPSPSARSGARAALMWRATHDGPAGRPVTGHRRRRPSRRLALGAALTATAAGVGFGFGFVQFTSAPDATAPPPESTTEASTEASPGEPLSAGQQILLAAATTALEQPAETGGYWYLKQEIDSDYAEIDGVPNPQILETWTVEDGREWSRNACCPDVHEWSSLVPGFHVGGSMLTYEELHGLPTDGERLKAWITDSFSDPTGWPTPGPDTPFAVPDEEHPPFTEDQLAFTLTDLLYLVPAPPEVRAVAFRALATMPDVTSLGSMDGGEGLRIAIEPPAADKFPGGELPDGADSITLVIDLETSRLLSVTSYADTVRILAAEWTDQGPPTEPGS